MLIGIKDDLIAKDVSDHLVEQRSNSKIAIGEIPSMFRSLSEPLRFLWPQAITKMRPNSTGKGDADGTVWIDLDSRNVGLSN